MVRAWFAIPLWKRAIGGLLIGLLIGLLAPDFAPSIRIFGDIFIRLIKMLVVPLVLVTIAAGITSIGDPRRLGSLGGRTLLLFAGTTLVAVSVGMACGLLIQPGAGIRLAGVAPQALGAPTAFYDQILGIVPGNLFDALARGDMLAIIFVAILLGIGTVSAGEIGKPIATLLQSLSAILLHIVKIVMELTPIGVLALIANAVAANGVAIFVNIGWLAAAVLVGTLIQMGVVHSALIAFVARLPVKRFFGGIVDALVVAFSTASSAATLPVAMRVAHENLGVARPVAATVLSLGASIGKDGTAMYVGLLGQFALQALGIVPTADMLLIMLVTGALAAFGTAPIPSASLFMLTAMLAAVGVGAEQVALIIGLVLPFDRLLDMMRTVPSASANLAVTTVVAKAENELDETVFRARAGV